MNKYEIRKVTIGDLRLDTRVQRTETTKLSKLSAGFDIDKVGVFVASQRDDNELYIIDGNHRRLAALENGFRDEAVDCLVYSGLSLKEEADLFLSFNQSTPVSAIDKFLVRVTRGDSEVLDIMEQLSVYRWRVGKPADGVISAVGNLLAIYGRGGRALLRNSLHAVTLAWGHERDGGSRIVLGGIAAVIEANPQIDMDRLIEKLRVYTPKQIHAKGVSAQSMHRTNGIYGVAFTVVQIYNERLQVNKLPTWTKF